MTQAFSRIVEFAFRFWCDKRAAILFEFAIILPWLIVLGFGGFEVSRYLLLQQQAEKTAFAVANLVAQSDSISRTEVQQMFFAVPHLMNRYNVQEQGRVIVSGIVRDAIPKVAWQEKNGAKLEVESRVGKVGEKALLPNNYPLASNDMVIVSEVFVRYTPLLLGKAFPETLIYKTAVYMPRQADLRIITP